MLQRKCAAILAKIILLGAFWSILLPPAHAAVTVRFEPSGAAFNPSAISPTYQWHTFYGPNTYGNGIAVDTGGNVYITGRSSTSWQGDGGANPLHSYSGSGNNTFILKLNRSGAYQWHTFYSGAGESIATDNNGNIYVTGNGACWLGDNGANPIHACTSASDAFILKLNGSGAYQWHTFYPFGTYEKGIAVDGDGDVYAAGTSTGSWAGDGGVNPIHAYPGGSINIVVLKLTSSGIYQWHTFYGSQIACFDFAKDYAHGLTVDKSGNVLIIADSNCPWVGDNGVNPMHPHSGIRWDITILKLNSNGVYQWHTFYGSDYNDDARGIATDGNGCVYVTGESEYIWQGDGGANPLHLNSNYPYGGDRRDIVVLKLDGNGAYQWHTFYGASLVNDTGLGIALDGSGNAYVIGNSGASWQGDNNANSLNAYSGTADFFMLKLNGGGAYQWHTFYGTNNQGKGIAVDNGARVYAIGYSYATWQGDGNTSPLHAYAPSTDAFILKMNDADQTGGVITAPLNNLTSGPASMQFSADAWAIGNASVKQVDFYVFHDGTWHAVDSITSSPYQSIWQTPTNLQSQQLWFAINVVDTLDNTVYAAGGLIRVNFIESLGGTTINENWISSRVYLNQRSIGPDGDNECAASSIAMVLAMNGIIAPDYSTMQTKANDMNSRVRGAAPSALVTELTNQGMNPSGPLYNSSQAWSKIKQEVDAGRPLIFNSAANVQTQFGHYFVVVGYREITSSPPISQVIAYDPFGKWQGVIGSYDGNTTDPASHKGKWIYYTYSELWTRINSNVVAASLAASKKPMTPLGGAASPNTPPDAMSDEPANIVTYLGVKTSLPIYLPLINR